MTSSYSPAWSIGFASLYKELSEVSLDVSGAIPADLRGTLYQIGPARFDLGTQSAGHWLDGFAMISSMAFDGPQATFTNRFLATSWYRRALIEGTIPAGGFDSPVAHHRNRRSFDNTNLNIIYHDRKLEALGALPFSVFIDATTMATVETKPWKTPARCSGSAPHPFFDQSTGERFDLALCAGDPAGYVITVTDSTGTTRKLRSVRSSRLGYMHSFSVTPHWIILVEGPFTASPRSLRSARHPYLRNYVWDASRGTHIYVLDRATSLLKTVLTTRPLFVLHHINAWEEGERIVTDLSAYADPSILDALAFDQGRIAAGDFPVPLATRLVISLDTNRVVCLPLKSPPGEFWKIDPRVSMKPSTVMFSAGPTRTGGFIDRLGRSDIATGAFLQWSSDNCYPGAPTFVPGGPSATEGEGKVLSIVLDAAAKRSFVLVLDAATLTELARAWLPIVLPFGLHAVFVTREVPT